MKLGLSHLIDPRLFPLVEGSRDFHTHRAPGRGPNGWADLRATRANLVAPPASEPPPGVLLGSAGGRSVPLRVHSPVDRPATAVLLEIHGGGFHMGSAAGGDIPDRTRPDFSPLYADLEDLPPV